MSHTPGPWRASEPNGFGTRHIRAGESPPLPIAEVFRFGPKGSEANARLIAAAPELLEALEAALPWAAIAMSHRSDPHPDAIANHAEDLARVQAAIAKAKGVTP